MKTSLIFTLIFAISFTTCVFSQKKKEGSPYSMVVKTTKKEIPIISMPSIKQSEIDNIKANNELDGEKFQFAYGFDVNIDVKENAIVDTLKNGLLYRLSIRSKGAKSLNVIFGKYDLPPEAKLYLYSKNHKSIKGVFTNENNKFKKKLAVEPVFGELITIEYFEPLNSHNKNNLIINKVSHDIYGIEDGDFGNSGDCQVDINCSEGNAWQDIKRSVVKIIINGTGLCSGALINNTANDETPYILTAAHCICDQDDAENSVYIFNYESPTCDGVDGSVSQSISGADVRATSTPSDFSLLELSSAIPTSYNVYFAGWDRRNITSNSGVGIHHPWGDVKKISTYNTNTVDSNCMNFNRDNGCGTFFLPNANFWRVNWIATANGHSVTEGGSSGSPLFNEHSRIVGQLWGAGLCDNSNCTNPGTDTGNYGKVFSSWDGANAASRLRDWLDPGNTGVNLLDGVTAYIPPAIIGANLICTSETMSISIPTGTTATWSVSPSNALTFSSGSSSSKTFTRNSSYNGNATITANVNGPSISFSVDKQVYVGTPDSSDFLLLEYNTSSGALEPPTLCQTESNFLVPQGNSLSQIDSWQWYSPTGWGIVPVGGISYPDDAVQVYPTPNFHPGIIYVRAHNVCGWSTPKAFTFFENCNWSAYSVYPNPSSGIINIDFGKSMEAQSLSKNKNVFSFELYDFYGNLLKSDSIKSERTSVDISALKQGIYILKVKNGNKTKNHRIVRE